MGALILWFKVYSFVRTQRAHYTPLSQGIRPYIIGAVILWFTLYSLIRTRRAQAQYPLKEGTIP